MTAAARYAPWSIALHWLMLLLLAAVYAFIELRSLFPRGSDPRNTMKALHFMLGLSVFLLVWLRLLVRLRNPPPPITPTPATWQTRLGGLVHIALYILMIGMPIAGWLILSGEGAQIPFFGLSLPPLMGPDKALASQVKEVHETVGTVGYWLIGLHAVAALFHHYWLRDDTLARMLPWRR